MDDRRGFLAKLIGSGFGLLAGSAVKVEPVQGIIPATAPLITEGTTCGTILGIQGAVLDSMRLDIVSDIDKALFFNDNRQPAWRLSEPFPRKIKLIVEFTGGEMTTTASDNIGRKFDITIRSPRG